jgi:hypothetical protein
VGKELLDLTKDEQIKLLRKVVKPYTREQMNELEKNLFYTNWQGFEQYNGTRFKVISERYEREEVKFGEPFSTAWIDKNGTICSERYFDIIFCCTGEEFIATLNEINGYFKPSSDTKE